MMNARMYVPPRPPRRGRTLLISAIIALTLGGSGSWAVDQFAPGTLAALGGALHPAAGTHTQIVQPVAHDSALLPDSTASMLQQFTTSISSYQTQPLDLQSGLRMIIPRIHVNAAIVERGLVQGWMVVAPGNNVTHFTFSSYPGAVGNSIMYSHDGTAFRHLDALAVGDTIIIQTPRGSVAFRIRELRIIPPTMLSVLDATQTPVLTLLTCFPYGVDSSRLAVIADLEQP